MGRRALLEADDGLDVAAVAKGARRAHSIGGAIALKASTGSSGCITQTAARALDHFFGASPKLGDGNTVD